jgi:hypothetical protein
MQYSTFLTLSCTEPPYGGFKNRFGHNKISTQNKPSLVVPLNSTFYSEHGHIYILF